MVHADRPPDGRSNQIGGGTHLGMATFYALMKANKDFVSYLVPNASHGLASRVPYIVERQRRFFRDHLVGPRD